MTNTELTAIQTASARYGWKIDPVEGGVSFSCVIAISDGETAQKCVSIEPTIFGNSLQEIKESFDYFSKDFNPVEATLSAIKEDSIPDQIAPEDVLALFLKAQCKIKELNKALSGVFVIQPDN